VAREELDEARLVGARPVEDELAEPELDVRRTLVPSIAPPLAWASAPSHGSAAGARPVVCRP
jgi:hypothetical protein